MVNDKLTLTVQEAAKATGLGINKMYELTHIKGFPVISIGKRRLIVKAKFTEWLETNIGSQV